MTPTSKKTTIRQIQHAACAHFRIGRRDMLSESRMAHLVEPRHVAMYLSRKIAGGSWEQIGRAFNRDHTTPVHAVHKIEAQIADGSISTLQSLAAIEAQLGGADYA